MRLRNAFLFLLFASVAIGQVMPAPVRRDPYGAAWNGDMARAPCADSVYHIVSTLVVGTSHWIWSSDYGAVGDGLTDDTAHLQAAINAAIASHSGLYIEPPAVAYRTTGTLTVSAVSGIHIEGLGLPHIRYEGDPNKTVLALDNVDQSAFRNIWIDANDVNDCNGVTVTGTVSSSQRVTFDRLYVHGAKSRGVDIVQGAFTVDFMSFRDCRIDDCQVGLRIKDGGYQTSWHNGDFTDCNGFAVLVETGQLHAYDVTFSGSGIADVNLSDDGSQILVYGGGTASGKFLVTGAGAGGGAGGLTGTQLLGFHQNSLAPSSPVVDYNAPDPLVMVGCKWQGNVELGAVVTEVQALGVQFSTGDFNGLTDTVVEPKTPIKCWAVTIDGPGSLTDPNVMLLPISSTAFPHGVVVTSLAIQTRGSSTYDVNFFDFDSPTDASPVLLGQCSTAAGTSDVNDIADVTVATGHTIVVQALTTGAPDQLQAIVYGRPNAR